MSKKTILILVLVLAPVALMVTAAATGWAGEWLAQFPNPHFVIAFALGATATVLLSAGLFALAFLSSRRGYDDRIGEEQDSDGP